MIVLAVQHDGREQRDADRAAEIADHVEQRGRAARLSGRDPDRRHLRERHHQERLAQRADELGPFQLLHRRIVAHVAVHEATRGEQRDAERRDDAAVHVSQDERQEGEDGKLRQAEPHLHHADLQSAVALHLRQTSGMM